MPSKKASYHDCAKVRLLQKARGGDRGYKTPKNHGVTIGEEKKASNKDALVNAGKGKIRTPGGRKGISRGEGKRFLVRRGRKKRRVLIKSGEAKRWLTSRGESKSKKPK